MKTDFDRVLSCVRVRISKDRNYHIINNGTGSIAEASLGSGEHSIFFVVGPTPYDFEKRGKLPAPLWSGKGTTESIGFIVNPP